MSTLTVVKPGLTERLLKGDLSLIFYISLLRLLFHFYLNATGGYGIFRDELYYLACAEHLSTGYVDQPPFSIYVLKFFTLLFGESLFVIRLVPALCGAFTVFVTGLITIRMGGKWFAQLLAGVCSMSLITIGTNSVYSMNSIDILCWTIVGYLVLRIIQDENKKLWLVLGLVLGIALLNKIGVLFLGCGLFVGLLISKQRRWLTTPWPYVAGLIAFTLFFPYVLWNIQHDYAHLEFIRNASEGKYSELSAAKFIADQFLMNNPLASVVWVAGIIVLLFHSTLRQFRWLAFLYLVPLIIFIVNGTSKAEYLAAGYGILWAAGSVWWEKVTMAKIASRVVRPILVVPMLILTLVFLPFATPILSVEEYIRYAKALGQEPSSSESKQLAELPQHYADMHGWRDKAHDVAKVFNTLSGEDKKRCAIFGNNYGDCGAIDHYGEPLGLPKSIGTHNNYWIWGPRNYKGEVMIIMGGDYEDHVDNFESVVEAAISDCQYCMPYEDNLKLFLCRGFKGNLQTIWDEEKHFD